MLHEALAGISPLHVSIAVFLGGAVGVLAWACERQNGGPPAERSFFMGMLGPLAPLLTQKQRDDDLDDDDDDEDRARLIRTIFPLVMLTAMVIVALTTHWPLGQ
jgi:hypothetical protein